MLEPIIQLTVKGSVLSEEVMQKTLISMMIALLVTTGSVALSGTTITLDIPYKRSQHCVFVMRLPVQNDLSLVCKEDYQVSLGVSGDKVSFSFGKNGAEGNDNWFGVLVEVSHLPDNIKTLLDRSNECGKSSSCVHIGTSPNLFLKISGLNGIREVYRAEIDLDSMLDIPGISGYVIYIFPMDDGRFAALWASAGNFDNDRSLVFINYVNVLGE